MTNDQLNQLLTAANPLTDERALELELVEDELLAALLAEPQAPAREPRAAAPRHRRRVLLRVGFAVAATALVLVALLSLRDDSDKQGSGTAWAAGQIRFAEASPLVLLQAPGWRVEYADEQTEQEGELHFRTGPARPPRDVTVIGPDTPPIPVDTRQAELHWRGGPLAEWTEDRANSASRTTTAPVLGTTAHVYQYEGGTPGHRDITALFRYDRRVLEFRAGAADIAAFKALLAKLARVDTDTWLSAMPPSVVKAADRGTAIKQMLRGVTVPPGFDPKDIKGPALTKDRYQLGAVVAGTVACQWFKQWAEARKAGDRAKERQATEAMATAKNWPILQEMKKEGDYPEVLWEFAAAMPSGNWYGRPLIGDVNSALGCDGFGVRLR
jgi:hypothetical protein